MPAETIETDQGISDDENFEILDARALLADLYRARNPNPSNPADSK